MRRSTRWFVGIVGTILVLLGLLCLNYTKMGSYEHHSQFAQEHGLPAPSRGIVYLGMLFTPLGGGLLGFTVGRFLTPGSAE